MAYDPNARAQSSMEYLTTFLWAFLIIALALGALYSLGVFGSAAQARAWPGSCQVSRPNGPGTISFVSLAGICAGVLPKFVSHFIYAGSALGSGNSNITVPSTKFQPVVTSSNNIGITITGWLFPAPEGNTQTAFAYGNFIGPGPTYNGIYVDTNKSGICNSGIFEQLYSTTLCIYNARIPLNRWMFVAIEYNGNSINPEAVAYVIMSGNLIAASGLVNPFVIPAHASMLISTPWNGLISNVQLYNTSLSQNAVYAVYKTGLGGAPINLRNLVGWWPLNGNANDYSGNNNNGYAYNSAFYSGTWSSTYLQP